MLNVEGLLRFTLKRDSKNRQCYSEMVILVIVNSVDSEQDFLIFLLRPNGYFKEAHG